MNLNNELKAALYDWYLAHRRMFPWRKTKDPYAIWISEIMLQQTTVAAALPYYGRWMYELPTLRHLAESKEADVLRLWQGLGYYRRAKNLRIAAAEIVERGWPDSYEAWLAVPGVGPYTAAALSSILLGEPQAVVDGNVERVYSRIAADHSTGTQRLKNARVWAQDQVLADDPGNWNQAMMELGSVVCRPQAPDCPVCALKPGCTAFQSWRVEEFPAKPPPIAWNQIEQHLVVPYEDNSFGIRKVSAGSWWQGMWMFPLLEVSEHPDGPNVESGAWAEWLGTIRHTITHNKIRYHAWLYRGRWQDAELVWVPNNRLEAYALPSPMRKALEMAREALGSQPVS